MGDYLVQQRELTHRRLWRIAEQNAAMAARQQDGWLDHAVVSAVFVAFSVEAYVNFVGAAIAPEVWQKEREFFRKKPYQGTAGKLQFVLERLALPEAGFQDVLATLRRFREFRGFTAHGESPGFAGRVEGLEEAPFLPPTELAKRLPSADLVTDCRAIESFLDEVHRRAGGVHLPGTHSLDKTFWGERALRGPLQYRSRS